jgi:hypothetical protein
MLLAMALLVALAANAETPLVHNPCVALLAESEPNNQTDPRHLSARIVENSPFAPFRTINSSRAAESRALELRGVTSDSDGTRYCIYDPQSKRSAWVAIGETGYPYTVTCADPGGDRVILHTRAGQELSLMLRETKISNEVVAASPAQGEAAFDPLNATAASPAADPLTNFAGRTREQIAALERLAAVKAAADRESAARSQQLANSDDSPAP